jgi:hypothetical protein
MQSHFNSNEQAQVLQGSENGYEHTRAIESRFKAKEKAKEHAKALRRCEKCRWHTEWFTMFQMHVFLTDDKSTM